MVSKTISLDDNYSLHMERDDNEKRFYLLDNIIKTRKLMATLNSRNKWDLPNENGFFSLAKKYESIFMNNIYKPMNMNHEITLKKQFNCFKRKFVIKVSRTINKIKHSI